MPLWDHTKQLTLKDMKGTKSEHSGPFLVPPLLYHPTVEMQAKNVPLGNHYEDIDRSRGCQLFYFTFGRSFRLGHPVGGESLGAGMHGQGRTPSLFSDLVLGRLKAVLVVFEYQRLSPRAAISSPWSSRFSQHLQAPEVAAPRRSPSPRGPRFAAWELICRAELKNYN